MFDIDIWYRYFNIGIRYRHSVSTLIPKFHLEVQHRKSKFDDNRFTCFIGVPQIGTAMRYLQSRMADSEVYLVKPHKLKAICFHIDTWYRNSVFGVEVRCGYLISKSDTWYEIRSWYLIPKFYIDIQHRNLKFDTHKLTTAALVCCMQIGTAVQSVPAEPHDRPAGVLGQTTQAEGDPVLYRYLVSISISTLDIDTWYRNLISILDMNSKMILGTEISVDVQDRNFIFDTHNVKTA